MLNANEQRQLLESFQSPDKPKWYCGDVNDADQWPVPDWTVLLNQQTYFVHTAILGCGNQSSVFFSLAMRSAVRHTRQTVLTNLLPVPCHKLFEVVLDFIYDLKHPIFSVTTVVPLYKIAHVLRIQSLANHCTQWLQNHLNPERSFDVLSAAIALSPLDTIVNACQRIIGELIHTIRSNDSFLKVDMTSLVTIFKYSRNQSRRTSKIAVHYMRHVENEDIEHVFRQLNECVQQIDSADALYLYGLSLQYNCERLQKRCLSIINQQYSLDLNDKHHILDETIRRALLFAKKNSDNTDMHNSNACKVLAVLKVAISDFKANRMKVSQFVVNYLKKTLVVVKDAFDHVKKFETLLSVVHVSDALYLYGLSIQHNCVRLQQLCLPIINNQYGSLNGNSDIFHILDETIRRALLFAKNSSNNIDMNTSKMYTINASKVLAILEVAMRDFQATKINVSRFVVNYLKKNPDGVEVAFQKLEQLLTKVHVQDALYLYGLSLQHNCERLQQLCLPIINNQYGSLNRNHINPVIIRDNTIRCALLFSHEKTLVTRDGMHGKNTESVLFILKVAMRDFQATKINVSRRVVKYLKNIPNGVEEAFQKLEQLLTKVHVKDALYLYGLSLQHNCERLQQLCLPIINNEYGSLDHNDMQHILDETIRRALLFAKTPNDNADMNKNDTSKVFAVLTVALSDFKANKTKVSRFVVNYLKSKASQDKSVVKHASKILFKFVVQPETNQDALFLFGISTDCSDGTECARIQSLTLEIITQKFQLIIDADESSILAKISNVDAICRLLSSNGIIAKNEDHIFEEISKYCKSTTSLTEEEVKQLWDTCRYSWLSDKYKGLYWETRRWSKLETELTTLQKNQLIARRNDEKRRLSGVLYVSPGTGRIKTALSEAKQKGIKKIYFAEGIHDQDNTGNNEVVVDYPFIITGAGRDKTTLYVSLCIQVKKKEMVVVKEMTVQHRRVQFHHGYHQYNQQYQQDHDGLKAKSPFCCENVKFLQCGLHGVSAMGTRGTLINCVFAKCKKSGVYSHEAFIVMEGIKTKVYGNRTSGKRAREGERLFELHASASSSFIQIRHPLTKIQMFGLNQTYGGTHVSCGGKGTVKDVPSACASNALCLSPGTNTFSSGLIAAEQLGLKEVYLVEGRYEDKQKVTTTKVTNNRRVPNQQFRRTGTGRKTDLKSITTTKIKTKNTEYVVIPPLMKITGAGRDATILLGGLKVQGEGATIKDMTIQESRKCGIKGEGGASFLCENVKFDRCGTYGVCAIDTGDSETFGTLVDCEVTKCGLSGIYSQRNGHITLKGEKTKVHQNCKKEGKHDYGLKALHASSAIVLDQSLVKGTISTNNGGGGNWGGNGQITTRYNKRKRASPSTSTSSVSVSFNGSQLVSTVTKKSKKRPLNGLSSGSDLEDTSKNKKRKKSSSLSSSPSSSSSTSSSSPSISNITIIDEDTIMSGKMEIYRGQYPDLFKKLMRRYNEAQRKTPNIALRKTPLEIYYASRRVKMARDHSDWTIEQQNEHLKEKFKKMPELRKQKYRRLAEEQNRVN